MFMSMVKFELLLLFSSSSLLLPGQSTLIARCPHSKLGDFCTSPDSFWQKDGICFAEILKTPQCYIPNTVKLSFIVVAAIESLGDKQVPFQLWIKGSGPGLSWNTAIHMRALKRGYWDLKIEYTYDSNALLCSNQHWCFLNQKGIELRFYTGLNGTEDMLGPNFFLRLPVSNSIIHSHNFKPPQVYFFPAFYGKKVVFRHFRLTDPLHFKKENQIIHVTLLYPPSYEYNIHRRYPVVIVLGNNLYHQLVPLLESMYYHESNIDEAFIVNVQHSGPPPYCAYNPLVILDDKVYENNPNNLIWSCSNSVKGKYGCIFCMTCYNPDRAFGCDTEEFASFVKKCDNKPVACHGRGGAILDSLLNIVLPELSLVTANRMLSDYPKERISIIGIDGGGLLACFAALSRPLVFKNAACLSAPFHWPLRSVTKKESRKTQGIGYLINEMVEKMKVSKELTALFTTQSYYIDVDTNDNKFLPIVDTYSYSDWVVAQLKDKLLVKAANVHYDRTVQGPGNLHLNFIEKGDFRIINRIKHPLKIFLKPAGGFNEKYSIMLQIKERDFDDHQDNLMSLYNISSANLTVRQRDLSVDCEKHEIKRPPSVSPELFMGITGILATLQCCILVNIIILSCKCSYDVMICTITTSDTHAVTKCVKLFTTYEYCCIHQ